MKNNRNINLDAMRAFAIIGVVTLHLVGGVNTLQLDQANKLIASVLLAITYCSVNLFGLLSGYLKIDRPHHNASIIKIVLQTMFWSFAITIVCAVAFGQRNIGYLIKNAFPFIGDRLWYITCYVFVFLCVPYLNLFANKISQRGYRRLLITLTVLMSIIVKDFFHVVNNGYSAAWLIYMYLLGGYFKKFGFNYKIKKSHVWVTVCITICALVASRYILEFLLLKVGADTGKALKLYYYNSPLTLLLSLCFLYLFIKASFRRGNSCKFITWLSTVSLGVYVIHAHPYCLDNIFVGEKLMWVVRDNPFMTLLIIFIYIFSVVVGAGIMEQIRISLFRVSGINRWCEKMGEKLDKRLCIEESEQDRNY